MTAVDAFHTTVFSIEGRVTVGAVGEIDFATLPRLRLALAAALDTGPRSVEVDLSGVSFCDCAGVNVLLWARQRARAEGTPFRVTGTGAPVVARIFHLLDIDHLLGLDPAR
ncbi:STAS domain-containing protein [Streptomyces sp. NBC_01803]|uniref:STAS domain-containing protein n=1 Tax=Streptomyces sp. NBC_01803 TaxID=2975946 RepID=UPI002DDAC465|nr:STAS domain-containing protein [Streptomyces sp. NBC_01803]WSA43592.1 STAS domain-containing protein [Streptomyces sp. NBC_01803]